MRSKVKIPAKSRRSRTENVHPPRIVDASTSSSLKPTTRPRHKARMEASAPLVTTPKPTEPSSIVSAKGKELEQCLDHHEEATDTCVICLSPITERAVTVPCNHLVFDFLCLVHWLQQQPNCPLCKATISAVEYDWRSPTDYKTYRVPTSTAPTTASQRTTPPRASRGRDRGAGRGRGRGSSARDIHRTASADQVLARRRQVYALHAYSLHVGANRRSEYALFTPQTFASSPQLQNRARIFLRRELQVFSFLSTPQRMEFVLEYIVAMLKSMEIKGADGAMVRLVGEMVGKEDAGLLCHELEAWLRSPFSRLEDWDAGVQYAEVSLMGAKRGERSQRGGRASDTHRA